MRQIVFSRGQPPQVANVPMPALKPGTILVRTHFSAVSVGTERASASAGNMSLLEHALDKPQQVMKVLAGVVANGLAATVRKARAALYEWLPVGYSNSGVIAAIGDGVSEFRVADRVACAGGGYAVHADYCVVPRRLATRVPDNVALDEAAFSTIGAVAMHGFRVAQASVGESVAVIGLGIVGQLLCQIAAAAGCKVIAMDLDGGRVDLAARLLGSVGVVVGGGDEVAEVLAMTRSRGVDAVFVCAATSSSDPARLAAAITRDRGRVVVVGDVGLELDRQPLYDKELELRVSRSYGPGRYDPDYEEKGIDYPFGYVRWTEQRNVESLLELMSRGVLRVAPLITHRFSIAEAQGAFELLASREGNSPIGALFAYGDVPEAESDSPRVLRVKTPRRLEGNAPKVGLIGPGAFAKSVILPALARNGIVPVAVAGQRGLSAAEVAEAVGAGYSTTETAAIFADSSIDAVIVTSRHDSHASLAVEGLAAGKRVYVEKPLATTVEEVEAVCDAYNRSGGSVMVGFNRRFAPFTQRVKAFLPKATPPVMLCRVNAGRIDKGHWSLSADRGAGRIIGEACHFVDLMQYIAASPVDRVFARALRDDAGLEQDVCVTLDFLNGAIGTLIYTAQGNARVAKEYFEVLAGGKIAIIEDFTLLTLATEKRRSKETGRQDKGFNAEIAAYAAYLRGEGPCPIPFEQSVVTSLATLAIIESCRTNLSVQIPRVALQSPTG